MYFEVDEAIPKDKKLGLDWYILSANNGWLVSIGNLGYSYSYGDGVKEDHQEALKWLQKVTKNDDNDFGEIDIETIYLFGNKSFELNYFKVGKKTISDTLAVTRDKIISPVQFLSKDNDNSMPNWPERQHILLWNILTNKKLSALAESQFSICGLYIDGKNNISRDQGKSLYWAKRAAKNGGDDACRYLGIQYEQGKGVNQDYKKL